MESHSTGSLLPASGWPADLQATSELQPGGTVMLHPLVGGLDPEVSWEMLEVFEKRVMPALSEA